VEPAEGIARYSDTPGSRGDHDARVVSEGRRERYLDVAGDVDLIGEIFRPQRGTQLLPFLGTSRTRGSDHQDGSPQLASAGQGAAYGFGCAIAALADITIASDASTFQIPEMEHNIMPTMVLSAMVDRMSRKGLTYMLYSCATVGPERALSHGIVSEVVPAAELDASVERLCKFMLKAPAVATEGAKEYLRRAMTMDVPSAVDYARNLHAVINSSSEMRKK